MIQRRRRDGRWADVLPTVYRSAGTAPTWRQQLMAAILWAPDAVVSHRSGAALHGLDDEPDLVEITIAPQRGCRRDGIIIHRSHFVEGHDRTIVDGIAVSSVARTIIDCAGVVGREQLEAIVDSALRQRKVSLNWLEWRPRTLGERGRRGAEALVWLLAARRSIDGPTESALEIRYLQLTRRAGMPRPVPQMPVMLNDGRVIHVDFGYPGTDLVVETDGWRWHGSRAAFECDSDRRSALAAVGLRVITVTWRRLRREPDRVVAQVREALAATWNGRDARVQRVSSMQPAMGPPPLETTATSG